MHETIVRSAFGVVLTRVERRDGDGEFIIEYRLSSPSGETTGVFDNFADADAAWLFSLGGEPGELPPQPMEVSRPGGLPSDGGVRAGSPDAP